MCVLQLTMKKTILLLLALSIISCKQEEKKESIYPDAAETTTEGAASNLSPSAAIGQNIFDGKGNCFSCHKPDQKVIGPGIIEIAKIYKEKNGSIVSFLKEEADPIVDPSQYPVMKTNFSITKNLTDAELKGLEDYFMSYLDEPAK